MDKIIVTSYGFVREADPEIFVAVIHLHIDGAVLEIFSEEIFPTKEAAIAFLKTEIRPITATFCEKVGLEITNSSITIDPRIH